MQIKKNLTLLEWQIFCPCSVLATSHTYGFNFTLTNSKQQFNRKQGHHISVHLSSTEKHYSLWWDEEAGFQKTTGSSHIMEQITLQCHSMLGLEGLTFKHIFQYSIFLSWSLQFLYISLGGCTGQFKYLCCNSPLYLQSFHSCCQSPLVC